MFDNKDISVQDFDSFVCDVVNKYNIKPNSVEYDNAINAGKDALVKALKNYDNNKGVAFSTFLYSTINLYVKQYIFNRKRSKISIYPISIDRTFYKDQKNNTFEDTYYDVFYNSALVIDDRDKNDHYLDIKFAFNKIEEFIDTLRDHKKPKSAKYNLKYDVLVEIYDRIYKNEERLIDLAREKGVKIQIINKRDKTLRKLIKDNVEIDLSILK
jgi:DNA-directed RNA polymerase sigma subunit (sigma70/sigma32)